MAFPPEFGRFENEEDFTDHFLIHLLQRLGFSVVINFHGTQEFGKDVILAEIDRFGVTVYHGLQAKFEPSIGVNAVEGLIDDAKQAFNNPFQHPHTGSQERISTFFAVNAGSISDSAEQNFFNSLLQPYGSNVRLFDGKALLALNRMASISTSFAKERLTGLILEIRHNRNVMAKLTRRIQEYLTGGPIPHLRLRLSAMEAFLSQPTLLDFGLFVRLERCWHRSIIVNNTLNLVAEPALPQNNQGMHASLALGLFSGINGDLDLIEEIATRHLSQLGSNIPTPS